MRKKSKLIYEPASYDASDPKKLKTIGGKTKGEWIRENNGWLVDILATKEVIYPDSEINKGPDGKEYTDAQKVQIYNEKYQFRVLPTGSKLVNSTRIFQANSTLNKIGKMSGGWRKAIFIFLY